MQDRQAVLRTMELVRNRMEGVCIQRDQILEKLSELERDFRPLPTAEARFLESVPARLAEGNRVLETLEALSNSLPEDTLIRELTLNPN